MRGKGGDELLQLRATAANCCREVLTTLLQGLLEALLQAFLDKGARLWSV